MALVDFIVKCMGTMKMELAEIYRRDLHIGTWRGSSAEELPSGVASYYELFPSLMYKNKSANR